jgi:hypothetical protein
VTCLLHTYTREAMLVKIRENDKASHSSIGFDRRRSTEWCLYASASRRQPRLGLGPFLLSVSGRVVERLWTSTCIRAHGQTI